MICGAIQNGFCGICQWLLGAGNFIIGSSYHVLVVADAAIKKALNMN